MSQTETHFGKLRRVVFPEGQTLEQWCEAKCNELGKTEKSSWCKTWYEQLRYINDEDMYWEHYDRHHPNHPSDSRSRKGGSGRGGEGHGGGHH